MAASDLFDLSGRVALVTGASRGIGRAVAEGLAEAGAHVALVSRSIAGLLDCARELRAAGRTAQAFPADVSRVSEIQALVPSVIAEMGQIDILVNAAATNRRKAAAEVTEEDWDTLLDVNLKGLFFLAQAVGRYWLETRRFAPERERGKGKIVNVASIGSGIGLSRLAPYIASKHGVLGVTRILALEWGADGICVNCLAPGYTETPLTRPLFDDPTFSGWLDSVVPMGRRGYPADMVGAAVFLAAPASDYITGQMIAVDGGSTAGWMLPIGGGSTPGRPDA